MIVPASAHMLLGKPYIDDGAILPKFDGLPVTTELHVLDELSAISFSISDYSIRLQAENDCGGVLDAGVDELCGLAREMFVHFIRSSFECECTCPGFKTTKELSLDVDRAMIWEASEATYFALDVLGLIHDLPGLEGIRLQGVPPLELSFILEYLRGTAKQLCPNLKRLHIEPISLRSPRSLLVKLEKFLAGVGGAVVVLLCGGGMQDADSGCGPLCLFGPSRVSSEV